MHKVEVFYKGGPTGSIKADFERVEVDGKGVWPLQACEAVWALWQQGEGKPALRAVYGNEEDARRVASNDDSFVVEKIIVQGARAAEKPLAQEISDALYKHRGIISIELEKKMLEWIFLLEGKE